MNVSNAVQSGFIGVNRGLDNAPKAAGDITGSGKSSEPELASGRDQNEAVVESAASNQVEAAATKVVSSATEPGEPGGIIDIVI